MSSIRAKVVCLLRNGDRILLLHITDPYDGRRFLIPPGGGVEFGETLEQAVMREIAEEVGIQIASPRRLGMFENIFRYAGKPEHELVFVYEAECDDAELCAQGEVVVTESNGSLFAASWYTLAEVTASGLPLFPEGLQNILAGENAASCKNESD